MSSCRHGGRDPYSRTVWGDTQWKQPERHDREMTPAIKAVFHFKGGMRPVEHTLARRLYDGDREVDHVEVDGVTFAPQPEDEIWTLEDGRIVAIERDGVRYVRMPERDWDSEVCE